MMLTVFLAAALQAGSLPVQTMVRDGLRGRAPGAAPMAHPNRKKALPRVVVDAGHGGVDVGAPMRNGTGVYEKDITLQVALKLGELLRQRGVDVVYTRTRDTLIALA